MANGGMHPGAGSRRIEYAADSMIERSRDAEAVPTAGTLSTLSPATRDPRPDLEADAALWAELLEVSDSHGDPANPAGVHGALLGARCFGARLQLDGDTLRLVAGKDADAYADVRERYLRPHCAHLVTLAPPACLQRRRPAGQMTPP
jgi:hypothetical protein